MKQVQGEEYSTVKDTAAELGINVNTLRTYSLLIEKTTGNKHFFERSISGGRLYTAKQVADLKAMIALKKNGDETLATAASSIYSDVGKTGVPADVANVSNGSQTVIKQLEKMEEASRQRDQEVADLKALVEQQSEKIEQLTNAIQTKPKHESWWRRLFK